MFTGIDPSGVNHQLHLYAVAEVMRNDSEVHACQWAHGSVTVPAVVWSSGSDDQCDQHRIERLLVTLDGK